MVVMVSHDLQSISSLCERVVWLDHGRIRQVGPPGQVIAAYQSHASEPHAVESHALPQVA